jgi:hypothetical protein
MGSTARKSPGILAKDEARRWLQRFEAIEEVDRAAARREGPRPQWSIATALSLIETARAAGFLSASALAIRESEDEAVRGTWDRLRAGLSK